jgi:hypothetical protein
MSSADGRSPLEIAVGATFAAILATGDVGAGKSVWLARFLGRTPRREETAAVIDAKQAARPHTSPATGPAGVTLRSASRAAHSGRCAVARQPRARANQHWRHQPPAALRNAALHCPLLPTRRGEGGCQAGG